VWKVDKIWVSSYFSTTRGGRTEDVSLLLHGRRGTGFSCSPLAPLSPEWERGWGRGVELKLIPMLTTGNPTKSRAKVPLLQTTYSNLA